VHAREVLIVSPVRTAIGKYNGSLKMTTAEELGAAAIRETLRRSGVSPREIGSVVMGNVIQAGNKMNPARQAAVHGGIPAEVPASTVNRVCGSGAEAVVSAAKDIWLGLSDVALAGGMENMDRAPYLMAGGRWGYRMGNAEIYDSMLRDGLSDAFSDQHCGWHMEDVISDRHISRSAQDRWAERSQTLFAKASKKGRFEDEIVPLEIIDRKGKSIFRTDETPRENTSIEGLALLQPAFRDTGTITAGSAPGLSSGASAMVLIERSKAERSGVTPIGRLVAFGVAGVEPAMFGLGPIPATRMALDRAGWRISDIDRIEINEAYAAVPLAVTEELGIPHDITNVEGGAVAHGHPIGATGAILVTRLLHSMRRDGARKGIVTLCIGGGQGIALALESFAG
jgi:acetyl-CoA C-acetyltransferase